MAKNTLSTTPTWIKVLIPLIVLFAGILVTWGRRDERITFICDNEIPTLKETDKQLSERMDDNCEKFEQKFQQQEAAFHMQNQAVVKLQSDVSHNSQTLDKIYNSQQEILKELRSQ
jgi:hypothetical protein